MIGTALGIASTLASLYGSIKSAEANKQIDNQINRRKSDLQSWYDNEYNTPYLDTADARGALTVLRKNLGEQMQKVNQGNAIKGASDEAQVATAEAGQKKMSDAVTRLAGYGTHYKDAIRRDYMNRQMALDNMEGQNLARKSQQWTNFMNNAMNAGMGFSEADANGAFKNWDGKIGGWFKGTKPPKVVAETLIPGVNTGY
jgi:hypothetical protein